MIRKSLTVLIITLSFQTAAENQIAEAEIIKYGPTNAKGYIFIEAFPCDTCDPTQLKVNINKSIKLNDKKISVKQFINQNHTKGLFYYKSHNNEVTQFQTW